MRSRPAPSFELLALFAEMERTFGAERAAHARSVAEAKNRRVGRPARPPRRQAGLRRAIAQSPRSQPRTDRHQRPASPRPRCTGTSPELPAAAADAADAPDRRVNQRCPDSGRSVIAGSAVGGDGYVAGAIGFSVHHADPPPAAVPADLANVVPTLETTGRPTRIDQPRSGQGETLRPFSVRPWSHGNGG
jgi:hypothetical protein